MTAFVGTNTSPKTELKPLLEGFQTENSYYFFRWYHQVSGFIQQVPDTLPPAGQLFNSQKELRWRWQNDQFHLLLLSKTDLETDFFPIKGNWQTKEVNAILRSDNPRFPKRIQGETPDNIAQRYFFDADTAIIHFIALTLKE